MSFIRKYHYLNPCLIPLFRSKHTLLLPHIPRITQDPFKSEHDLAILSPQQDTSNFPYNKLLLLLNTWPASI